MSITMSTKRNKKTNLENASPLNGKKKAKNIITESENNVTLNRKPKKKENLNIIQNENKLEVKASKKRKQTADDIDVPAPKKVRKREKEQVNLDNMSLEDLLSMPSGTNSVDVKQTEYNLVPPKRTKKKAKIVDGNRQAYVIKPEQDNSGIVGEIPIQHNGKRKERNKLDQQEVMPAEVAGGSLNMADDLICKEEMDYNHVTNNFAGEIKDENVVNITLQSLQETDSDQTENESITDMEKKIDKVEHPKVAKIKEVISWPTEDLKKLVERMEACIPQHDVLAFSTRAEKLEWNSVAFKNYTVDDCKKTWALLQKQIRKFRLLREVLQDAKEWIQSPKPKSKRPTSRHPDMPRKPLTAYFIYYLKKKDTFHKAHPGLDATEISKILGQEFKNLPAEKRMKYEKLAAKKKEEYEHKLDEFYKTHPEIPRIVKVPRARPEKPSKPQRPPKPPKPVKEKPPPKPKRPSPPFQYFFLSELDKQGGQIEDRIAFKEQCKERWKELNDKKKLIWINYAEAEYAKYEETVKQYLKNNPDYIRNPNKPVLSKEEIQIKERVAGKPTKPPGSAYNLFARMLLQSDEIKGIPIKDRLNFVSSQWKNCMEEEKKQYRDLSAKLNEKYKLDFASYLETLPEEERKRELQKTMPKRRKSEDGEKKVGPSTSSSKKKKSERKSATKKLVEPEQPPISAFKYFATLYTGEEPVAKAWKALTAEQKKIYEDELVKKKQAYIVDFEKFLKSLTKEELEAFSNSRKKIKKEDEDDDDDEDVDEEESSDESGTEDSEVDSNDEDDDEEEEEK